MCTCYSVHRIDSYVIFNRIPADIKARGTTGSWLKIKSVGKAIINGSAEMKKFAKPKNRKTKLNHKTKKP